MKSHDNSVGIVTGYGIGWGSIRNRVKTGSEAQPAPVKTVMALSLRGKADQSFSSNAEVKNIGTVPPTPCFFTALCLIN
jgi:hypothetical protein